MPETSNDPRYKIKIGKKLLELSNIVEPGYSKTRGKRGTYLLNNVSSSFRENFDSTGCHTSRLSWDGSNERTR